MQHATISVIADDRMVVVDGVALRCLGSVGENIHALHWRPGRPMAGYIEYKVGGGQGFGDFAVIAPYAEAWAAAKAGEAETKAALTAKAEAAAAQRKAEVEATEKAAEATRQAVARALEEAHAAKQAFIEAEKARVEEMEALRAKEAEDHAARRRAELAEEQRRDKEFAASRAAEAARAEALLAEHERLFAERKAQLEGEAIVRRALAQTQAKEAAERQAVMVRKTEEANRLAAEKAERERPLMDALVALGSTDHEVIKAMEAKLADEGALPADLVEARQAAREVARAEKAKLGDGL